MQIKKVEDQPEFPALVILTENIYIDPLIVKETDRIIDEKNQVRNNASTKLAEIRRKRTDKENQATRRINQLFSYAKKEG
jgi:dsDNA-specific endonuclease/ATPase MutS2